MRVTSQTSANTSIRVFVGLSGGVDSAVSAALLKQQGYDVAGVFIRIALDGYPCTAGEDKIEAQRVAAHLKIPFKEVDLSAEYKKRVFETSVKEFAAGRTPNPDALCNREIKFGLFFEWCVAQGAELVATGHYAQVRDEQGRILLKMGADKEKDQSYFLWAVPEVRLRKTLFPIGHLQKAEVRKLAQKFGLPNAERKDSQGLCFLGPVSVQDMLHKELSLAPGLVLDEAGAVVGEHEGAQAYTLGQRHGYALAHTTPLTPPHFVIAKDAAANTITVSPQKFPKGATHTHIELAETNWIGPYSAEAAKGGELMARYRYRQELIPAEYQGQTSVVLLEPHYAPEGQSLVLYEGERCLGGGVILSVSHGDTDCQSGRHAGAV